MNKYRENHKKLIGQKFGRLTIISFDYSADRTRVICKCDCGKDHSLDLAILKRGDSKSCGCLQKELTSKKHTIHGMHSSRLYICWNAMKSRCSNLNRASSHRYIGRGITFCEEWKDFNNFKNWALENGYEDNLTLDRIDNNLGYFPENCKWSTQKEQCKNRGNKENRVKINDLPIDEICELYNLSYQVVLNRFRRNWSFEKIINTPIKAKASSKNKQ